MVERGGFFFSMVIFLKLKQGSHVQQRPQWIVSSLIWTVQLQKKEKKLVPQDHESFTHDCFSSAIKRLTVEPLNFATLVLSGTCTSAEESNGIVLILWLFNLTSTRVIAFKCEPFCKKKQLTVGGDINLLWQLCYVDLEAVLNIIQDLRVVLI